MLRSGRMGLVASILVVVSTPVLMGALGRSDDFQDRILAAHNLERSQIGVPPLKK